MNNKIKPALIGGGALGLLLVLRSCFGLPYREQLLLPLGDRRWRFSPQCFMYIKNSPTPVSTTDGATVGAMSGAVGAVIYFIIGLPIALFFGVAQMEETIRRSGMEIPLAGTALALLSALVVIIIILICSTLGGLVGVPIFEKRKGPSILHHHHRILAEARDLVAAYGAGFIPMARVDLINLNRL